MDAVRLSEHIAGKPDLIIALLESIGITDISHQSRHNQFRFARYEGGNPSSVIFNVDNLSFKCFSTGERGSVYTLIMERENLNFPASLSYAANVLGLETSAFTKNVERPFNGFYQKLMKEIVEPEYEMKTYDDSILEPYKDKYNLMFFKDGIDFQTQAKFNIGFDLETNRITIPIRTLDDKLCGIIGRLNDSKCAKEERYIAMLPCQRSLTIYSYNTNYASIQQKGLAIIGESEKSVMQMHSFGCKIGLSVSGCCISRTQAKYLKALMIPRIILAFDEGLGEEQVRNEAEKLRSDNPILKNRIGYVLDRNNEFLPKGSKASPSDLGRDAFSKLVSGHVIWLD